MMIYIQCISDPGFQVLVFGEMIFSKHEALTQRWFMVGTPFVTLPNYYHLMGIMGTDVEWLLWTVGQCVVAWMLLRWNGCFEWLVIVLWHACY